MSGDAGGDDRILVELEERIHRAVAKLRQLADENRALRMELAARPVGGNGSTPPLDGADHEELARERDRLLADRQALTRRVEEILARLEYLESESPAH